MKRTYESFEELAAAMCDGEGVLHAFNCARNRYDGADPCLLWQTGVQTFAEWLDHIGLKVEITDAAENFYEFCAKRRAELERIKKPDSPAH